MPPPVKTKSIREASPVTLSGREHPYDIPDIKNDDSFRIVVKKLSLFFVDVIDLPSTFEQLRTTAAGEPLRLLVDYLGDNCTNPAIVHALLALKWHYSADSAHQGLSDARSNACEIVAWRFLTRLSEREAVHYCLYEIPEPPSHDPSSQATQVEDLENAEEQRDETTSLLPQFRPHHVSNRSRGHTISSFGALPRGANVTKRSELMSSISRLTISTINEERLSEVADPTEPFTNLNALEIAAIANAKRFLGQHVVQKIITGIWNGDIIFWDSLSVKATKMHRFYNPNSPPDPFSRLRVPKYLKFWEVIFFAMFLFLYYSVLVEQSDFIITPTEIGLYLWFAAFLYDEISEWSDAGSIFYTTDLWNLFDMIMITIGFTFAVLRIVGITQQNSSLIDIAYDVLALEALFVMPRICSLLSLSPYWGTLIPCLKEMAKDFIKFMVLIIIIYVGFLTTFCLIGRESFSTVDMIWKMTKIFYGQNVIGFEMMDKIDQVFGPPLMIIFITLSSILLMGSMTGMLSNSFSRVIKHAREEYLYVYSIYVLEASTSNRLTHFYPPFNLIALVMFRPLRYLCFSHRSSSEDHHFRAARILLLKVTHLPLVGAIYLYELVWWRRVHCDEFAGFKGPRNEESRTHHIRRPVLRSRSRPTSATPAPYPPRPGMSGRKESGDQPIKRPDGIEGVEAMMGELHRKIDQLTTVILTMQQQQELREQKESISPVENDEARGRALE